MWLMLGLKIPIAALLWIVWWAVKSAPDQVTDDGDGGIKRDRHGPSARPPKGPRRGPSHAAPLPPAPPRVRTPAVSRDPARPHR